MLVILSISGAVVVVVLALIALMCVLACTIKTMTNVSVNIDDKVNNDRDKKEIEISIDDVLFELGEYEDMLEEDGSIIVPIKGINFRDIKDSDIGYHEGYLEPESHNVYDEWAIAIYGDDRKLYGYIPKGQRYLNFLIKKVNRGRVPVEINVGKNEYGDKYYFGDIKLDVYILFGKKRYKKTLEEK